MPNHPKYGYVPFPIGMVRGPFHDDGPRRRTKGRKQMYRHNRRWSFMVRVIGGTWAPYSGFELQDVQRLAEARGRDEIQKVLAICREDNLSRVS